MKTAEPCICVFFRAQNTATGTVSGTVLDQGNKAITNAAITVKGPAVTRKTTTNAEGCFTATGLLVSTYNYTGSISHPFAGRAF